MAAPKPSTIRAVVGASIVVTALHFTDNYVSFDTYPTNDSLDWITEAVVVIAWPLLTAFGVAGYLLYRGGRYALAHACLLVYAYTGLSSLGHFLAGPPGEFTTRGLVSIFLDGAVGATVLAVTIWSIAARRRSRRLPHLPG